jgi:glutathione S-transferase
MFYVSLTPDKDALFAVPGFTEWWAAIEALPSFQSTPPM